VRGRRVGGAGQNWPRMAPAGNSWLWTLV
jgi:hypothetical protein